MSTPIFDYRKCDHHYYGLFHRLPMGPESDDAHISVGTPDEIPVLVYFYLQDRRAEELYQRLCTCFECGGIEESPFDQWIADNECCVHQLVSTITESDGAHKRVEVPDEEIESMSPTECFKHLASYHVFHEFKLALSMRHPTMPTRVYLCTTHPHSTYVRYRCENPVFEVAGRTGMRPERAACLGSKAEAQKSSTNGLRSNVRSI